MYNKGEWGPEITLTPKNEEKEVDMSELLDILHSIRIRGVVGPEHFETVMDGKEL